MNPKTTFLFILILSNLTVFSQETWTIKYDEDGSEMLTDTNDYAYRREFVRVNNSISAFISFTNGNVKVEKGNLRNNLLHGYYEYYFSNGKVNFKGEYKNDKPVGIWHEYYMNGTKKSEYSIVGESETDYLKNIRSSWDSLGSPLIINGNGRQTIIQNGFKIEEIYKDGLRDGEIKIYDSDKSLSYSENYKEGKFVKGYNHFLKIEYENIYIEPEFYGEKEFEKFVYYIVRKEFKEIKQNAKKPFISLPDDGKIETEITISKKGEVVAKLINTRRTLVAELFLNAIQKTSNAWLSAKYRGENIESTITYSFNSDAETQAQKRLQKLNRIINYDKPSIPHKWSYDIFIK